MITLLRVDIDLTGCPKVLPQLTTAARLAENTRWAINGLGHQVSPELLAALVELQHRITTGAALWGQIKQPGVHIRVRPAHFPKAAAA